MAHLPLFLWTRRKDEGRLAEAQPYSGDTAQKPHALYLDLTQAQSALECRGKFMFEGTLE